MKILAKLKRNSLFKSLSILFFLFFSSFSFVFANDVTVTAKISDTEAPSTPILISPSDGALISDNTPDFQWYESTDNVLMNYYVFYLNGSILYNNVPLVNADNSSYTLEYDSLNGIYTLTPKNAIADGSRTWKVVAVDYAYNTASSDTWDFTLDTQAPSFVLKKIGDTSVSISASDPNTVPNEPIIIFDDDATANEPLLVAIGEANSTVQLTVTIPDDPTQNFTTTIDGNGNYELQLGILPRDTNIELDFIITDQVGHVSVLEDVYFRIALQYWPTATPTPIPTTTGILSPTPIVTIEPTAKPTDLTASPIPSTSILPTGIVPIIPPKEIIHEASDEIIEMLPDGAESIVRTFFKSKSWLNLSLLVPFIVLFLFYFISFILLLSKFIDQVSPALLKKIFLLLFPYFSKAKKHLVFEYGETLVAPLVKVNLLDNNKEILDFDITNLKGNFSDLDFSNDRPWFLTVKDNNFYFPIGEQKPEQLSFLEFYQGQELNGESYHNEPILIPTLRATGQEKLPFIERIRLVVLYLLDYPLWFLFIALLFSLLFALRYQSVFNSFSFLFLIGISLIKFYQFFQKKKLLSFVVRTQGTNSFTGNLIVSLFEKNSYKSFSAVVPFEFSKTKKIKHDFKEVEIEAFAKNLLLANKDPETNNLVVSLNKEDEEILLQINTN